MDFERLPVDIDVCIEYEIGGYSTDGRRQPHAKAYKVYADGRRAWFYSSKLRRWGNYEKKVKKLRKRFRKMLSEGLLD